uniref:ADP-ribosylglycohydrolase family protein n=1 Tax=Thaumasiovibrio occultus TaxID=1891184 RepID=UPI000B34EFD5|nr:ADP-ribosylglycohydrolase family protein [Thaumasiovibrio occultus]
MSIRTAALFGALVADAAALGTHWIYSPPRIQALLDEPGFPFITPDPDHYEGVEGYFAHGAKAAGELSPYGEWLALYIRTFADPLASVRDAQMAAVSHFGPGGEFIGYIDSPTRALLTQLMALEPDSWPEDSGSDDDQNTALCAVAPLVCTLDDSELLTDCINQFVGMTHQNDVALASAHAFAAALKEAIATQRIENVLNILQLKSPDPIQERIVTLRNLDPKDDHLSHVLTVVNQACHLADSLPLSAWLLSNATSYRQVVLNNILASGDSCGRAIMIGAIAGACFGIGGEKGIPISWLTTLQQAEFLSEDIELLFATRLQD